MTSFEPDSQTDLFPQPTSPRSSRAPLADRMRPRSFAEFVGQEAVLAEGQPLRRAIEADRLPSLILWGPPGSGKTTLATLIAQQTQATFVSFSAVLSGVPELRKVLNAAQQRQRVSGKATLLFVDEIHRFNKAQQDAFLPHVERGEITLIGATTQNPSFEVIAPLLSRAMVVVLKPLHDEALERVVDRALSDQTRGLGAASVTMTRDAKRVLVGYGNGDARSMLTALEFVVTQRAVRDRPTTIEASHVQQALQRRSLRYDRNGEEHYNLISAFIKSMRDSDADGALYWLARMLEGGEDSKFIARRMMIFASEDIGMADAHALPVASAVFHAVEAIGLPEAQINLAHGATYLAMAPKSNASYVGLLAAQQDVKARGNLPVPLHLRNAATSLMKGLGYGKHYRYAHDDPRGASAQTHLPCALEGRIYYRRRDASTSPDADQDDPSS